MSAACGPHRKVRRDWVRWAIRIGSTFFMHSNLRRCLRSVQFEHRLQCGRYRGSVDTATGEVLTSVSLQSTFRDCQNGCIPSLQGSPSCRIVSNAMSVFTHVRAEGESVAWRIYLFEMMFIFVYGTGYACVILAGDSTTLTDDVWQLCHPFYSWRGFNRRVSPRTLSTPIESELPLGAALGLSGAAYAPVVFDPTAPRVVGAVG